MIEIGQTVRFEPSHRGERELGFSSRIVCAKVIYINRAHGWCLAEWVSNGNVLRETLRIRRKHEEGKPEEETCDTGRCYPREKAGGESGGEHLVGYHVHLPEGQGGLGSCAAFPSLGAYSESL